VNRIQSRTYSCCGCHTVLDRDRNGSENMLRNVFSFAGGNREDSTWKHLVRGEPEQHEAVITNH
jgi:transposase